MDKILEASVDKFIFRVLLDRRYSVDHLWFKEENGFVRIGVTDYLQQVSGDVAFAEPVAADTLLESGAVLAVLETIKVTQELTTPIAGRVRESNQALQETPELINQDPYERGWLVIMEPDGWGRKASELLGPQEYFERMKEEAEEENAKR